MSGEETSNERTILDYLNEYCWQEILGYIPVRDVLQSERVSRQWQNVVLVHLRKSARFGIAHPFYDDTKASDLCWLTPKTNCYHPGTPEHAAFNTWLQKHGPEVAACYCDSEEHLSIFRDNCHNLEFFAMLYYMHPLPVPRNSENVTFKFLKRCEVLNCAITDQCVSQFIRSDTLEEFIIISNNLVNGQCLLKIESPNLKTLILKHCKALETCHMLSAIDRLKGLTKLELAWLPLTVDQDIHLVIERLAKLEYLRICSISVRNDELIDAICRLRNLKDLSIMFTVVDKDVEDLMRCCVELRTLILEGCNKVKTRGVAALCAGGERVTRLDFGRGRLDDADVGAVISGCPNLTSLDVSGCLRLTPAVLRRAAAARRVVSDAPLRLFVPQPLGRTKIKYEELVIEYCYSYPG